MGGEHAEGDAETASSPTRRGLLRAAAGAVGGAATAGTGTVAAQDGAEDEVRQVEMTDDLVFVPEEITVTPGDTVRWVNVGEIPHTVTAYGEEIPDEAEYFASGGFEGEQAARDAYPPGGSIGADEEYSHTFEVPGDYGYFCIPHEQVGMVGTVTVTEPGGAPADGAAAGPALPDSAKTIGVATVGGMASVLGLAYFFIKYGGEYVEAD